MSPLLPSPEKLLVYLPDWKVIICTSPRCQHALAPDAISRHLKEIHKLGFKVRNPYLQHCSTFELASPQELLRQSDGLTLSFGSRRYGKEFPVPLLPIYEGFICLHEEGANEAKCQHLCMTEKRMRIHWGSCHKQKLVDWRRVRLQTWFKGNMLRYFTDGKSVNFSEKTITVLPEREVIEDSDAALFNHFTTSTYQTLAEDVPGRELWRVIVPALAQKTPYLMHGLLALAALHLFHLHRQSHLTITAAQHQAAALPLFSLTLYSPTNENCHAFYVFSHVLIIYSAAVESRDEELFIASNSAELPQWLYLIRNGCSILCDVWDYIVEGPLHILADRWELQFTPIPTNEASILSYFEAMIPSISITWTTSETRIFRSAAKELSWASCLSKMEDFNPWDALRAWPLRVDEEFLDLVFRRHPGALILLAHYAVILRRVGDWWYFKGRAEVLLRTVLGRLDVRYWESVRWPIEEVLGFNGGLDGEVAALFRGEDVGG